MKNKDDKLFFCRSRAAQNFEQKTLTRFFIFESWRVAVIGEHRHWKLCRHYPTWRHPTLGILIRYWRKFCRNTSLFSRYWSNSNINFFVKTCSCPSPYLCPCPCLCSCSCCMVCLSSCLCSCSCSCCKNCDKKIRQKHGHGLRHGHHRWALPFDQLFQNRTVIFQHCRTG